MAELYQYLATVAVLLISQWTEAQDCIHYSYSAQPPAVVTDCNPYSKGLKLATTVRVERENSSLHENYTCANATEEYTLVWYFAPCVYKENVTRLNASTVYVEYSEEPYWIQHTLEVFQVRRGEYYSEIATRNLTSQTLLVKTRSEYGNLRYCKTFLTESTMSDGNISVIVRSEAVLNDVISKEYDCHTVDSKDLIAYISVGVATVLAVLAGCICLVCCSVCRKRRSKNIAQTLIPQTDNATPNSDSIIPISTPPPPASSFPRQTERKPLPPLPGRDQSQVVHVVAERDSAYYHIEEEEGASSVLPQAYSTTQPGTSKAYHVDDPTQNVYAAACDETLDDAEDHIYEQTSCETLDPPEVKSKDGTLYHAAHPKLKKRSNPYTRPLPRPKEKVQRKSSKERPSGYKALQMMDYASIYTEATSKEEGEEYHKLHALRKQSDHVYTKPTH